jgi:hypothetical protein
MKASGLVWGVGLAAACAMLAGGIVLLLRGEEAPGAAARTPVAGQKLPSEFGLPNYPHAFAYHSQEYGPHEGSVAFSVERGTAAEVARFYRERLGNSGWRLLAERPVTQSPGDPAAGTQVTLHGVRQQWLRGDGSRELRLLALDYARGRSKAQVALSWSRGRGP